MDFLGTFACTSQHEFTTWIRNVFRVSVVWRHTATLCFGRFVLYLIIMPRTFGALTFEVFGRSTIATFGCELIVPILNVLVFNWLYYITLYSFTLRPVYNSTCEWVCLLSLFHASTPSLMSTRWWGTIWDFPLLAVLFRDCRLRMSCLSRP